MYLHKFIAGASQLSRRKIFTHVKNGEVSINGKKELNFNAVVKLGDKVAINNKVITFTSQHTYLVLYKPRQVLTTLDDPFGRKTIVDCIPEKYANSRIFPVGRLDYESEGLLILTNDGDLSQKLTHPKYEKQKEYEVVVSYELESRQLHIFKTGVKIESGYVTKPVIITKIGPKTYRIILTEGKKRQIRQMFSYFNIKVTRLIRTSIGPLKLSDLKIKSGEIKEIDPKIFE